MKRCCLLAVAVLLAGSLAPGRADGFHLGVGAAQRVMEALADHLSVAPDDRAHQRVGADPPASPLGQLDRALEVREVDLGV